jgi:hypothetical protein
MITIATDKSFMKKGTGQVAGSAAPSSASSATADFRVAIREGRRGVRP